MAKKPIKSPKKKAAKKATAVKKGSSVKSDIIFTDPLKLAAKASARKMMEK